MFNDLFKDEDFNFPKEVGVEVNDHQIDEVDTNKKSGIWTAKGIWNSDGNSKKVWSSK